MCERASPITTGREQGLKHLKAKTNPFKWMAKAFRGRGVVVKPLGMFAKRLPKGQKFFRQYLYLCIISAIQIFHLTELRMGLFLKRAFWYTSSPPTNVFGKQLIPHERPLNALQSRDGLFYFFRPLIHIHLHSQ